ncbi:hypothetical protein CCZ01_02945 [Helicobacter monodelphidis]|uniref:cache domain-containing protein n=1 Tax=Helicobacter sp. 15-1451 TaxID=2004995 RepID=UPI000DCD2966|nr:cache domain-containing protein [Helicobacter sp. 15-1451]RAX58389.1 hypothetical protein CCZ01_02945 [Helicobacter sp. 15-1451]
MEQQTINTLGGYMPDIAHYRTQFLSLNSLLGKTTLTGKISSLDIAENLFQFMGTTQQKFNSLQDRLINTLIEQNFLNRFKEASVSSNIIASLLLHTIGERSLDVIALARSSRLANFLQERSEEGMQDIREHLQNYIQLYTIYHNLILFDIEGNVLLSLEDGLEKTTTNSSIRNAIREGESLEIFESLDFYHNERKLLNIAPVKKQDGHILGALGTVFDLKGELTEICQHFKYHLPQSAFVVLDAKSNVVFSDEERYFPVGQIVTFSERDNIRFTDIGKRHALVADTLISEQKNITANWRFCRIVPLQVAFDSRNVNQNFNIPDNFMQNGCSLRTENLDAVVLEAENINEDLGDVVINGEIIASKSRSYALNPILDNIRLLSDQINTLCIESIQNLQKGIFSSLYNTIDHYARSSVELLDRYLYEKANDCRWMSQSSIFKTYLENKIDTEGTSKILKKLEEINTAYPSYGDIVLFDANGVVLANSHHVKGTRNIVSTEIIGALRGMTKTHRYHLSNFEVPAFSSIEVPSYTFSSPIRDSRGNFLGGIAFIVSGESIQNILFSILQKESFLLENGSDIFALFIDQDKNLIATTRQDFDLNALDLEGKCDLKNPKSKIEFIEIDNVIYLVSIESSVGYREFKLGNTRCGVISCLVFIKIRNE